LALLYTKNHPDRLYYNDWITMNTPETPSIPDSGFELPPPRIRRRERIAFPTNSDERTKLVGQLNEKVTPTLEFFFFTMLSAIILGAALYFDSFTLVLLAMLVAPFMSPVLGISLSAILGSWKMFLRSIGALLVGSLIIFGLGALSGWIASLMQHPVSTIAVSHLSLNLVDPVVLVLGMLFTMHFLTHNHTQRPLIPSIAIAYGLFLPLAAAGFGITSGVLRTPLHGLFLFALHLALAVCIGIITLVATRLSPAKPLVSSPFASFLLIGFFILLFAGLVIVASRTPTLYPSGLAKYATTAQTPTPTLRPTLITKTPTKTVTPSLTPTVTPTLTPTPSIFIIHAFETNGVIVHIHPGLTSDYLTTLFNGVSVLALPDPVFMDGRNWIHIRLSDGREGWILETLLVTPTPIR
jgi:uncharacterized membrane protein